MAHIIHFQTLKFIFPNKEEAHKFFDKLVETGKEDEHEMKVDVNVCHDRKATEVYYVDKFNLINICDRPI